VIGSTVGPYRIVRKISQGGMGVVYEAMHDAIERRVAIKVLHADLSTNHEVVARFFNEAKAVNRIDHPGIVQCHDFGHLPDGTAFIVMEYLKGETLSRRNRRMHDRMPLSDIVRLVRQIAAALAAAHAKNIVHRERNQLVI
jgi:serine/threonine protein kinase